MAPLLWQAVNPSFSFAATARVSFSTCHFDSLPDALVLVTSVLACLRRSKDHWRVTRGETREDALMQTDPDAPPEWRLGLFFFSVCSCSSLCRNKQVSTHLMCFILLALLWHWNSLPQQCISVHVAPPLSIGIPSIQCPWVTIYHPSGPLLWNSRLTINHLRWAHMPTHMSHVWAPHRLYPSSSSDPNIHWLNHQLGLLHRPLWPNEHEKWAVKELGGGQDTALTLGSDSRVGQTV